MKKLNKKGFTIVELVIVIAVIAILAGVLIPTFATVVNRANESAAMQQAKNAYEDYLAGYADSKDLMTDFYIKVDSGKNPYYFQVTNGQFNSKAVDAPTASDAIVVSLENKSTTFTTDTNGVVTSKVTTAGGAAETPTTTITTTNPNP